MPKHIPARPPFQANSIAQYVADENDCRRLMAVMRAAAIGDPLGAWLPVGGDWRRVEVTPETVEEARAALTPEMQARLSGRSESVYWRRTAARVWPEFAARSVAAAVPAE